jgi:AcrR family transcriptional regulator
MCVMNEPTSARVARSREKLVRAATDLLVEAGPRGVTVDAVAERSGVAKSTLYRHWSSRDDMLVDVVRCNVPDSDPPELSLGCAGALRAYVSSIATSLADPEWSRIVPALMSLRATMPELAAVVDGDRDDKAQVLRSILDLGVEEGVLSPPIDVEESMILLVGPLVFASITGQDDRLAALADQVVERFMASDDSARAGTRIAL